MAQFALATPEEQQRLRAEVEKQLQRHEKGETIGFGLDMDRVAAGIEFMRETDTSRTIVKFYLEIDSDDEVFAVFPERCYDLKRHGRNMLLGFEYAGHCPVHVDYIAECKEATPEQYKELYNGLLMIGYANLKIENK